MAARIAAAAFLLVSLFSSGAIAAADFDFFYYVLMWPGAYCRQERRGCCLPTTGKPEIDFFVRGLMPYKKTGEPVTKCNSSPFYINELRDLIDDMYAYWPNIKCPRNNGLTHWKNQWKTYGTCSGLSEKEYFERGLQLHSTLNMLTKLRRAGIEPTNEEYSSAYVQAAVNDIVGQKVGVRCGQTDATGYQLYEIWICVDKTATTIIPCPVLPRFNCSQHMMFTTFSIDMMKAISLSLDPIEMPTTHLLE